MILYNTSVNKKLIFFYILNTILSVLLSFANNYLITLSFIILVLYCLIVFYCSIKIMLRNDMFIQGSYTFLPTNFHDFSMTFSMTFETIFMT